MLNLHSPKGSMVWPQDFTVVRHSLLRVNPRYVFRASYSPTELLLSERRLFSRTRAVLRETRRNQGSWTLPDVPTFQPLPRNKHLLKTNSHRKQATVPFLPPPRPTEPFRPRNSPKDLFSRPSHRSAVKFRPEVHTQTIDPVTGWTDDLPISP